MSLNEKKNILEIQNKSFLRKKWEKTLKDIIVKRIPKIFINKNEVVFVNNEEQINDLVDPRLTAISTILKHVHKGTIESGYTLLDGEYEFIEAEVLETSELISKSIKESNLPKEIRIGAVVRKKEVIIPKSDFVFEKKDLVVFLTKREHLEKVESLFRISSLI